MKKIIVIIFLASSFFTKAQETSLNILGSSNNFYLNHTAAAKENFYSIGRMYNISPKEIAPFNATTLEKGMSIGQVIKVPLKDINFTQSNKAAADEATVPIYHTVDAKETLTQIATKYNNVSIAFLKIWNNLQDGTLSIGEKIIVGYLKVKKETSPLASQAVNINELKTVKKDAPPKVVTTKEVQKSKDVVIPKEKPLQKTETKIVENPKAIEKEIVKKKPAIINEKQVQINEIESKAKDFNGGVFKNLFSNDGIEENGTAGVFKSLSGWQDGKYYCLHNKAQQNTILKITNKATGKFIYAKVLDIMPDLKQNNNLQIRISNAAADILGGGLNNFECKIEY